MRWLQRTTHPMPVPSAPPPMKDLNLSLPQRPTCQGLPGKKISKKRLVEIEKGRGSEFRYYLLPEHRGLIQGLALVMSHHPWSPPRSLLPD